MQNIGTVAYSFRVRMVQWRYSSIFFNPLCTATAHVKYSALMVCMRRITDLLFDDYIACFMTMYVSLLLCILVSPCSVVQICQEAFKVVPKCW